MAQVESGTAEGLGSGKVADSPAVSVGTDAAYAPAGPGAAGPAAAGAAAGPAAPGFAGARTAGAGDRPLRNISEMRHFFRTNDTPIYFIGATPFNLLGLDRWIRNFSYVTYYDGWDGAHPRVFTPRGKPYIEFSSGEEINNCCWKTPRCGPSSTGAGRAASWPLPQDAWKFFATIRAFDAIAAWAG